MEILKNKNDSSSPVTIFGVRGSAIIEIIIFLTTFVAYSEILGDGNRFLNCHPHPFWIILLLITVQYGKNEAVFCVILMTFALYFYNKPEPIITESLYDYWLRLTKLPLMWTSAAVILGGLRSRKIDLEQALRDEIEQKNTQNAAITDSYKKLQEINEALERRLAGEVDSAIKIYEAAKTLENLERSKRIDGINDIVSSIMKPNKFSFYTLEENGLKQLSEFGWDNEGYKTSFDVNSRLFNEVVNHKRILAMINEKDEEILAGEGMLAGPLIDIETGEVHGMLKFEEFGFKQMTLRNLHMFKILCEWIGMAMANMNRIDTANEDSMVDRKHMLYSYNFLKLQSDFLTALAKRMNFYLTKLNIKLTNPNELSENERLEIVLAMGNAIKNSLRQVDQFFDEKKKGEEFAILLPGTAHDNAEIVINKIKDALKENTKDIKKAKLSYTVQTLNKAK